MPRGIRNNPKFKIDRGAPASVIAEKFGGLKAFSEALDRNPSTIHRWLRRGTIDGKHQQAIQDAAKRNNVRLKPADFVDTRTPEQKTIAAETVDA